MRKSFYKRIISQQNELIESVKKKDRAKGLAINCLREQHRAMVKDIQTYRASVLSEEGQKIIEDVLSIINDYE